MALRWGEVCRDCKGSCTDVPSELEPAFLQGFPCESCGGVGCESCRNQGKVMITGCPKKMVSPSAVTAIRAADFARKGVLPLAGGWLDQSDSAMRAIRFIWDCEEVFRAKAGIKD